MKCKHCGKEFDSSVSEVCPYCGTNNKDCILKRIFKDPSADFGPTPQKGFDPDNCGLGNNEFDPNKNNF